MVLFAAIAPPGSLAGTSQFALSVVTAIGYTCPALPLALTGALLLSKNRNTRLSGIALLVAYFGSVVICYLVLLWLAGSRV